MKIKILFIALLLLLAAGQPVHAQYLVCDSPSTAIAAYRIIVDSGSVVISPPWSGTINGTAYTNILHYDVSSLVTSNHTITAWACEDAGCTALSSPAILLTSPGVSASPTFIDFGNIVSGSSSAARTVTLTNVGSANLVLGTLAAGTSQFSISADTCSGQTLTVSGGSCSFAVTFSPTSSGLKSDSVTVPSNTTTMTVALTGNGTAAAAQYSTDFSSYTVGSAPSDWTARWETLNSTWVTATGGVISAKKLSGSQSLAARYYYTWDKVPTNSPDVETLVLGQSQANGTSASAARTCVRGSGSAGNETAYCASLLGGTSLSIFKYVNAAGATFLGTYAFPWNASTRYYVRFKVSGSTLTARAWAYGGTEPGSVQITASDSSITAPGWTGIGAMNNLDSPSYDWFSAGTGGAAAPSPTPLTWAVTPSVSGANGTISPATVQTVTDGSTTQFTVTPSAGYSASVGGTCGGSLTGTVYTTSAVTAACTVIASFTQITHTVTPSAGANGSIDPATPQTVNHGSTKQFTVTPSGGFAAAVGGTCGGTLAGTTYTTNAIGADCTVEATFAATPPTTYTVTPSAGANVAISPSGVQTVNSGTVVTFTVTPAANYTAAVAGTCGGTLTGTTYVTNAVTGNCTVVASASIVRYTVTPSAGSGGSISPAVVQTVNSGSTKAFTVSPNAFYSASVAGTCGGTLLGTTYTTAAVTANCTVVASFTALPASSVSPVAKDFGSVLLTASSAAATFTVTNIGAANLVIGTTALAGTNADQFSKGTDTCNGQTIAASGTCTVAVTFSPTTAGAKAASLSIPNNASGLSVPLAGTGVTAAPPAVASLSLPSFNFGATLLDGIAIQTITLTNTGGVSMTVGTLALSGTNVSEFGILNDTCSGQAVAATANCTFRVSFSPGTAGSKTATLSVPVTGLETQTVVLTGTGRVFLPAPRGGGGHRGSMRFPW